MQINISENVKKQYEDDRNLATRIAFHNKYSTNNNMTNWKFDQYQFPQNCRILELGCGNGGQWEDRIAQLPKNCILILTDLSEGMVDLVREKYAEFPNVLVQKMDIQNIPFPDNYLDIVIANHMLYHVPDVPKAISEVYRVLKAGGIFYTTTNGNGGMMSFLDHAFKQVNPKIDVFNTELPFSLQNGQKILNEYFPNVKRVDYEDSLAVTETKDLIDWIKSTIAFSNYNENDLENLYEYFENSRIKHGSINIPKEVGMFISQK